MSFRARAFLNCTRIPRTEPSYIVVLCAGQRPPQLGRSSENSFLKGSVLPHVFTSEFCRRSSSWGKRSMSLHRIQEIRNLVNVFTNNVFVAPNCSRCVVLKLYVSCNSQIVITCLEVVWWKHITYIKWVLSLLCGGYRILKRLGGWLECLIVTVNRRTSYIQSAEFHVGGI
jgi:hypothetical protein